MVFAFAKDEVDTRPREKALTGLYEITLTPEAFFDEAETTVGDDGVRREPLGSPVEWFEEETFFFRLSPYQDRLLAHYDAHPDFIGPPERRNEAMEHLSRGMQQKVALARALLTSPVLLLLDEPTTGLDPRSKLEVQEFIKEVRRLHDATILLCTHDMNEAETLADRIGILDRGELLFLEPVEDVKRRFGVETLEEAFFAATGRAFEEEEHEDDEQREVFG